jgi:predicted  nucleic acid-binding Zn-ribbon protein
MEQVELIRQYQRIDAKLDELEGVVKNSEVRKKLIRARQYLLSSQDALQKMDAQADEMRVMYETIFSRHQQMLDRLSEMASRTAGAGMDTPLEQVEGLRRETQEIYANLGRLEKDLQGMMVRLKAISDKIASMVQNVPKAKRDYAALKKIYDDKVGELEAQCAPYKAQLKELEGRIDRALLKRYRNVKQTHAIPLAAVLGNRCAGCNMELPYAMMQRVKEGSKLLECENCGRILFVSDKT